MSKFHTYPSFQGTFFYENSLKGILNMQQDGAERGTVTSLILPEEGRKSSEFEFQIRAAKEVENSPPLLRNKKNGGRVGNFTQKSIIYSFVAHEMRVENVLTIMRFDGALIAQMLRRQAA